VPALREAAPALPLEVHSHNTVTMAGPAYVEAVRLGASFVCTAVRPLANGTSQPSAEQTLANLHAAGFDTALDEHALAEMSMYFTRLAARLGRPSGVPLEYDVSVYGHQLPGGMTSTLRRQLAEVGMEDRWDDVLAEIPRVREELGWPIMVTPLSQFIGVQAFLNVTTGKRWSQIPDEVVRYVLGHYGPSPGELDPEVRANVLASAQAEQFQDEEHRLDLAEARARFGDRMSDEELLLRMTLPADQVDALQPSWRPTRLQSPVVELIEELAVRPLREIEIEAPGMRLRLRR
jgi:oxaloacetate decarboxylase alpha subunit